MALCPTQTVAAAPPLSALCSLSTPTSACGAPLRADGLPGARRISSFSWSTGCASPSSRRWSRSYISWAG
eukprot:8972292-Pyramimonas_sp.AAC.1